MNRGNARKYHFVGYDLWATENCWVFEFRTPAVPGLSDISYDLGDGSRLHVGDRVSRLGGERTSAGFRDVHLVAGYLEYVGAFRHCGNWTLLFRYSECADPAIYYGFGIAGVAPLQLCFSTPAVASRLVQTTLVERA
ncbi:MAG: hypothetical protein V4475_01715 [Pseudomonadota bacterium]